MKRSEPLKRTTQLVAKTGLRRTTELQARAFRESLSARKAAPKKRRRSTVELRAALASRSGGWCEMRLDGCEGLAVDPCHRIGTGMGGRHGDAAAASDRLSNAVHGCRACHDWQHAHPAMAKAFGLILPGFADPQCEPVLLRYGVVFLDDEGGLVVCPSAAARDIHEAASRRATSEFASRQEGLSA